MQIEGRMTIEEQTPTTKRQRNRTAVQPIHLQERDLDMLLSISIGRCRWFVK
jgi:hypothetical protein